MAITDLLRAFGRGQFGHQRWPRPPISDAPDFGETYTAGLFPNMPPPAYPGDPGPDMPPGINVPPYMPNLKMGDPNAPPPPPPDTIQVPLPKKKPGILGRINEARFTHSDKPVNRKNENIVIGKNPQTQEEITVPAADLDKRTGLSLWGRIVQHLPRDIESGIVAANAPSRRGVGPNLMAGMMAGGLYSRQQDLIADQRHRQSEQDARLTRFQDAQIAENLAQAAYYKKQAEMNSIPKQPTTEEGVLIDQYYQAMKRGDAAAAADYLTQMHALKKKALPPIALANGEVYLPGEGKDGAGRFVSSGRQKVEHDKYVGQPVRWIADPKNPKTREVPIRSTFNQSTGVYDEQIIADQWREVKQPAGGRDNDHSLTEFQKNSYILAYTKEISDAESDHAKAMADLPAKKDDRDTYINAQKNAYTRRLKAAKNNYQRLLPPDFPFVEPEKEGGGGGDGGDGVHQKVPLPASGMAPTAWQGVFLQKFGQTTPRKTN